MKTAKIIKEISPIQQLRDIRDKIGLEIQNMTFNQLKKYVEKRSTLYPKEVWLRQANKSK